MQARSAAQVLKKIKCAHLYLYKGEGYWYFIYDDGVVYESESVMVIRLNDMTVDQWVDAGEAFLERCKKVMKDKKASYENMSMVFLNMKDK